MIVWFFLALLCLAALTGASSVPKKDFEARQYFVVEIDHSHLPHNLHSFIESHSELQFEHPVRGLDDHYVFSIDKSHDNMGFLGNYNSENHELMKRASGYEDAHDALINHPGLKLVHMLHPKKLERRMPVPIPGDEEIAPTTDSLQDVLKEVSEKLNINDPLFLRQWHLINTQFPGNDVNVKNVWYEGIRGKNITVAVIDDGLDHDLQDLKDNFNAEGSWDFNENKKLPTPHLWNDWHGTRCAGEIAAVKNDVCGIGVAFEAKVSGIRILSGVITQEDEAAALVYGLDTNDIYSCSWGPSDLGKTVAGPDMIVRKAMIKGIQKGRQNKGAVYVFASGNGAQHYDQCNFDGYTNSIYSITVGAIDHKNLHPVYAEACSAVMVVTYSSGSGEFIHTTDIKKKCSLGHSGTSAAAPLAAGIYALGLEANPDLTWRDVQHISARAAVTVNEDDGDYQKTALGLKYSHKYGYGKIDAEKLVEEAKKWKNVKPQAWYYADTVQVEQSISSNLLADSDWISSAMNITEDDLQLVNFESVEHVTVTVNIESKIRGNIKVRLISPHGIVSTLAEPRPLDLSDQGLKNWTFLSVAHFGEDGVGEWKLEVSSSKGENSLKFKNWQLRLFGEVIDARKAEVYDINKDYAAERRDFQKERGPQTTRTDPLPSKATTDTATETETNGGEQNPEEAEKISENKSQDDKSFLFLSTAEFLLTLSVLFFILSVMTMRYYTPRREKRRRRSDGIEFDLLPSEDYRNSTEEERDTLILLGQGYSDEANPENPGISGSNLFQIGDDAEDQSQGENRQTPGI